MGLHGRLSNTPAEKTSVIEEWVDGQYQLAVSGSVCETCFFYDIEADGDGMARMTLTNPFSIPRRLALGRSLAR